MKVQPSLPEIFVPPAAPALLFIRKVVPSVIPADTLNVNFDMKMPSQLNKQVIKLRGHVEEFNHLKISESIWMAAQKVGGKDRKLSQILGQEVRSILEEKYPNGEKIRTTEIGEL